MTRLLRLLLLPLLLLLPATGRADDPVLVWKSPGVYQPKTGIFEVDAATGEVTINSGAIISDHLWIPTTGSVGDVWRRNNANGAGAWATLIPPASAVFTLSANQTTNLSSGQNVRFDTQSGSVTLTNSSGTITVTQGDWTLTGQVKKPISASGFSFRWRNVTSGSLIGSTATAVSGEFTTTPAVAVIEVSTSAQVRLEVIDNFDSRTFSSAGTYALIQRGGEGGSTFGTAPTSESELESAIGVSNVFTSADTSTSRRIPPANIRVDLLSAAINIANLASTGAAGRAYLTNGSGGGTMTDVVTETEINSLAKLTSRVLDITKFYTNLDGTLATTAQLPSDTDDVPEGAANLYHTPERVQDIVAAMAVAGTGVDSIDYDDGAGTLTFNMTSAVGDLGDLGDVVGDVTSAATAGQVLKFNGTAWAPGTDETSGGGTPATTEAALETQIGGVNLFSENDIIPAANIHSSMSTDAEAAAAIAAHTALADAHHDELVVIGESYLSLLGWTISASQINLAAHVFGVLPESNIDDAIARDTELHEPVTLGGTPTHVTLDEETQELTVDEAGLIAEARASIDFGTTFYNATDEAGRTAALDAGESFFVKNSSGDAVAEFANDKIQLLTELTISDGLVAVDGALTSGGQMTEAGEPVISGDAIGEWGNELTDDPADDRLIFFDKSSNTLAYLTAGSGLTITGTSITASGGGGGGGTDPIDTWAAATVVDPPNDLQPFFDTSETTNSQMTIDDFIDQVFPMVKAVRTTTQSISQNSETAIQFTTTAHEDIAGMHDGATNNTRLIAKTAGTYEFFGTAEFAATSSSSAQFYGVARNSSGGYLDLDNGAYTGTVRVVRVHGTVTLTADDWIDFAVYQNISATLNVNTRNSAMPFFAMRRIGD